MQCVAGQIDGMHQNTTSIQEQPSKNEGKSRINTKSCFKTRLPKVTNIIYNWVHIYNAQKGKSFYEFAFKMKSVADCDIS